MPCQACICCVADCNDLQARISVISTMRPINEIFHFWWRKVLSRIVQLLYILDRRSGPPWGWSRHCGKGASYVTAWNWILLCQWEAKAMRLRFFLRAPHRLIFPNSHIPLETALVIWKHCDTKTHDVHTRDIRSEWVKGDSNPILISFGHLLNNLQTRVHIFRSSSDFSGSVWKIEDWYRFLITYRNHLISFWNVVVMSTVLQ